MLGIILSLATCQKQEEPIPAPIAKFSYDEAFTDFNVPTTIDFINESENADTYLWEFPGGTSSDKDLSLIFKQAGQYKIKLTATGKGGTDSFSLTVTVVNPPKSTVPVADFSFDPVNPTTNDNVQFKNQSVNATSFLWNFGDGSTSSTANPAKQFTKEGTYSIKLTATGSGGSAAVTKNLIVGKAATVDPYGKAVFWATGSWDYVEVETEGITYQKQPNDAGFVSLPGGRIEKPFSSAPDCGTTGAFTTERPARSYSYKATAYKSGSVKVAEVSGNYTVKANGCTAVKLDFPAATGQVVFWTDKSSGWSSIDVTLNGTAVGSITGYSTSAPACGTSKAVTVTGNPGTYSFSAKSNTGATWNSNITITANQCRTQKLEFTDTPATTCDWTTWSKYVTVNYVYQYNTNGCSLNKFKDVTLITFKNVSNITVDYVMYIQRQDGTWTGRVWLWKLNPGQEIKNWDDCGLAKQVVHWVKPTTTSSNLCKFPEQPN